MSREEDRREAAERVLDAWLVKRESGQATSSEVFLQEHEALQDLLAPLVVEALNAEELQQGLEGGASEPASEGRQLGDFRLGEELGRGGMGIVYEAQQLSLRRRVALKVLPPGLTQSTALVQRFRREAQALAKLQHPGVVPIHAVGEEQGVHFFAMELIDGPPLDQVLQALGARSPAELRATDLHPALGGSWVRAVAEVALQVAQALHAAHERGVIHRDVKPSNILLNPAGRALLSDFGLARDCDGPEASRTGELRGTVYYMSPEQALSGRTSVDRRTDVYSLGVTLYELLALRRPFVGETAPEVLGQVIGREPHSPEHYNPGLPSDLASIVLMAMDRDATRRYATAADMAADLQAFLDHCPVRARRASTLLRVRRWARREPWKAALYLVLATGAPAFGWLAIERAKEAPLIEMARRAEHAAQLEAQLEHGYLELGEGGTEAALLAFEAALSMDPESLEAQAGLALALHRDKRSREAWEVLSGFPSPSLLRLKVDVLEALDRQAEARTFAEQLVPPQSALDHFIEGERLLRRVHEGKEEEQAAIRAAHRAVLLGESRPLYHYQLAHAVGHAPDSSSAQDIATALSARWGEKSRTHFWAGFALQGVDPCAAVEKYEAALGLEPEAADVHAQLGTSLMLCGRPEEAEQILLRAIEFDPENKLALSRLAALQERSGRLEQAQQSYVRLLDAHPEYSDMRVNLALVLQSLGDQLGAEEQLNLAVEQDPLLAPAWRMLSAIHRARGETERALETARAAVVADPTHINAQIILGNALLESEEYDSAIQSYQAALAIDRSNALIHQNLLLVLRLAEYDAEVGAEHLRWAELQEQDHEAWSSVVQHQMEQLESGGRADLELALQAARRAVELTERQDAEMLFGLGRVLHASGQVQAAARTFAEADEVNESAPRRSLRLRRLIREALETIGEAD